MNKRTSIFITILIGGFIYLIVFGNCSSEPNDLGPCDCTQEKIDDDKQKKHPEKSSQWKSQLEIDCESAKASGNKTKWECNEEEK